MTRISASFGIFSYPTEFISRPLEFPIQTSLAIWHFAENPRSFKEIVAEIFGIVRISGQAGGFFRGELAWWISSEARRVKGCASRDLVGVFWLFGAGNLAGHAPRQARCPPCEAGWEPILHLFELGETSAFQKSVHENNFLG
jgi:hypothetical protein